MSKPCAIPFTTMRLWLFSALVSFGLGLIVSATGCGTERVVTAAEETSRSPAHVKPETLPPLQIRQLPTGDQVISLDSDLYFSFDSAALTAAARSQLGTRVLRRVLAFLAEPGTTVAFQGYTDGAGESAYNLRLSLRRAQAPRRFLIVAGAPAARLSARGFGEAKATSSLPDQALRRVDVVLRKGAPR